MASVHTAACSVSDWIKGSKLRGYTGIEFPLADGELGVLKRPGYKGAPFINDFAFVALAGLFDGKQFVASGDWNTSRAFDRGQSAFGGGPEFFARAADRGWFDCHGEPEEPSYYKRHCTPYQLDHAFCDAETFRSVASC